MSNETIQARQSGHEIREFIESQGIIVSRDGHRVTCSIEDIVGVALTLCAYERSLERERCASIADTYAASGTDDERLSGLDCRMHVEGLAAEIRKD